MKYLCTRQHTFFIKGLNLNYRNEFTQNICTRTEIERRRIVRKVTEITEKSTLQNELKSCTKLATK